jgi:flap endonuclease-1
MGVAIGSLIKECKEKIDLNDFKQKTLGFDAYNILYQFVTTIRGSDGQPLTNSSGEITSHINGLFYRVCKILNYGIKPVFVFDGESNILKKETKEKRSQIRTNAKEKYKQAIKEGNIEETNKYARQSATINKQIIQESKEFLLNLGVDYINAPGEAESQIAYLTKNKYFDYSVSQDFDCILFGSPNLLKNISVSGKRKVPGKNIYIDVYPYKLESKCIFNKLGIDRKKLIWLSIFIGTDFNKKIKGIGPKTALKLVKKYDNYKDIIKELESKGKKIDFDFKEIENIFYNPNIDKDPKIEKGKLNIPKLKDLLINKYEFNENRINNYLNKFLKNKEELEKQKTIDKWF